MKRGNVNTLATGDWIKTKPNSRYSGLRVGRDDNGFYLFYMSYGEKCLDINRFQQAIDIPDSLINQMVERELLEKYD